MAFAGLLSAKTKERANSSSSTATPASADAAAGGAAGDHFDKDAETKILEVPPQPCPPVRMPVRSMRGFQSGCSSPEHSPGASNRDQGLSPPGTPSNLDGSPALSKVSMKTSQSRNRSGLMPGRDAQKVDQAEADDSRSSCFSWWSSGDGTAGQQRKAKENIDWKDFCCLRDTANYRRFEPILEDQPETEFDKDVMMLDLHSVLRHHAIEPNEALVNDIWEWQVRSAERTSVGQKTPLSSAVEEE